MPLLEIKPRNTVPDFSVIIDFEALVLGKNVIIIEDVGLVVVNNLTRELQFAMRSQVAQPYTDEELALKYNTSLSSVRNAIAGYYKVTGQNTYIHPYDKNTISFSALRRYISSILHDYSCIVWAKGASLERKVLPGVYIYDLEDYGCPSFPKDINHDPLEECLFFANYLPIPLK